MSKSLYKHEQGFNKLKNPINSWTLNDWNEYLENHPESDIDLDDISYASEPYVNNELSPAQYYYNYLQNEIAENKLIAKYEREEGVFIMSNDFVDLTMPRKNEARRDWAVIMSGYMTATQLDEFKKTHVNRWGKPETGLYTMKELFAMGLHVAKKINKDTGKEEYVTPITRVPLWTIKQDFGIWKSQEDYKKGVKPVKVYEFSKYALAKAYKEKHEGYYLRAVDIKFASEEEKTAKIKELLYEKPTNLYAKEQCEEIINHVPHCTPYIENYGTPETEEVPF